MSIEVKICGLCRPGDARAAEDAGAGYLGIVFAPSPRAQTRQAAAQIWADTSARRVGVFVDAPYEEVRGLAEELRMSVIQLQGAESPDYCRRLREAGDWSVWKAIKVRGNELQASIDDFSGCVDGALLEGWSEKGAGGVGARFDWAGLSSLRGRWLAGLTLILAGGLTVENVAAGIEALRPNVVDVSSGVEVSMAEKDPELVREFIGRARRAAVA